MTVLAVLVALYALALLLFPNIQPPFLVARRSEIPWAVFAHLAGSLWALATGPFQLSRRIRERAWSRHRWLGRSYVAGVAVGALGAIALAPRAQTGAVAAFGFGTLGILWAASTLVAFVRIRRGDRESHRRWMMRSYASTLAAVTLRIYIPLSLSLGAPFPIAYPVIAWMCWVPNLIVAELLFVRQPDRVAPNVAT
jgi:uncharacterized membrane protein